MAKRIYLGREVSKYAEIAGGAIITISSLFFVLMFLGFTITGSDDYCLGTPEDPCVSYGKICNTGPDNYDIYNPDEIKMDFSPSIPNSWMFFKDGRVKKNYFDGTGINFDSAGWRYENFTNATKPRSDRVYVHRFARYSCQDYMLVGLKENPDDLIKWGVGVGAEYLDPFWYGVNTTASTLIDENISVEFGTELNIRTTFWNESESGQYYPDKFDINGLDGWDITTNGTYFWIPIRGSSIVERYDSSGFYLDSTNISIGIQESIYGITNNNTYFWVTDIENGRISRYYINWTYVDYFNYTETPSISASAVGLSHDNTYLWIAVFNFGQIYRYYMNGTYVDYFNTTANNDYSSGVIQNGTYIWVSDFSDDEIYRYYMNGTYVDYFNTTQTSNDYPVGLTFLDGIIYVNDYLSNQVFAYYLNGTSYPETGTAICVDIDHPEYGNNYSCGNPYVDFDFNISYFRNNEFNDSSTSKTFNTSNITAYIKSHQYDELKNLSINITGIGLVNGIYIYINNTLARIVLGINGESSYNATSTEEAQLNLINSNSTTFKIPKSSTVLNTSMNFSGNILNRSGIEYIPVQASGELTTPATGTMYWMRGVAQYGWTVSTPWPAYDGDFFNYLYIQNSPHIQKEYAYVYENYTIPTGTVGANWTVKYSVQTTQTPFVQYCWNGTIWKNFINYTTVNDPSFDNLATTTTTEIPLDCLSGDKLQLNTTMSCYNGREDRYWDGGVDYEISSYPYNLTIEVGAPDGSYEYEGFGEFNGSNSTSNFTQQINDFLEICVADDDGNCDIPIYFNSDYGGSVTIDDINIYLNYTLNPVVLDRTIIENFIGNSTNDIYIPIKIEIDSGSINVSDLRYDYFGGNDTVSITTYEQGNTSNNETLNVFAYYSSFFKNLPYTWANKLFFIPTTNSSKNVTAYGQTTSIPAYNITTTNYGGDINLSIRLNESFSCLNLSWSQNATKNATNQINTTWQTLSSNLEYLNNTQIWFWADFDNCNASDQRILQPFLEIEGYCVDCEWI